MLETIKAKRRVHLLHIGKTGGTAIRHALRPYRQFFYNIQLHGHGRSLAGVPRGEKVVLFLRSPHERLASGFYSRYRKGQPRYYKEWSAFEEKFFAAFKTPNEWAIALGDSSHPEHDLAVAGQNRVTHLKPYTSWCGSVEYFKSRSPDLLLVGCQETLDYDFVRLKRRLLIPPMASLPKDDISSHKTPAYMDKTLSEAAQSAVRTHYAGDYALHDFALAFD